jgi:hypothetical protein
LSEAKVRTIIKKFAGYLKQEMKGQQEETLDGVLRKHCAMMSRHSWRVAQNWCKWDDENGGPVLFPDCTRLYYRKANSEIIVQEFKPQIRMLRFRGDLFNLPVDAFFTYSLALPYTIFVFKFKDGLFQDVYAAFSACPLKKLDEQPMLPYLPNINNDLRVCLGKSFNRSKLIKDQLTQQCAFVLDHFWNSLFNKDWAQNYFECERHFAGDARMCDLQCWQEHSGRDPLFVIDDVEWKPSRFVVNFGDLIVRLLDHEEQDYKFREELYQSLNDSFVKEAQRACEDKLDAAIEKLLQNKIKELTKFLDKD